MPTVPLEGHIDVYIERVVNVVATGRIFFRVEDQWCDCTTLPCGLGHGGTESEAESKPTLLSIFAQAIGPLPPFLLFFWLQRFLPGRRQFYLLPGPGPKECFPRLATAFGTVNRLAPWLKDTRTLCQHAVAGREKGKSWTHGTKDGPSHISVNLLK